MNGAPNVTWRTSPNWRADLIAGLTAAAVIVPKGMGYATIASLPVQIGLYTVFTPMLVYALLGTSRPLGSGSPTEQQIG
jgi:MFS superfamily sulfate permease-like transporter